MSKESFIGGDYTETTGGSNKTFAKGIIENIGSQVIQDGKANGVFYGTNEKAPDITAVVNLKKILINFRRRSTYDGKFGFDWLRDEYISSVTEFASLTAPGIIKNPSAYSLDIPKLKTEYLTTDVSNKHQIHGKDYYCSFLNLMLGQEVLMDLEVEELETLSSDATEIIFESSNADLTITPSTLSLSSLTTNKKKENFRYEYSIFLYSFKSSYN